MTIRIWANSADEAARMVPNEAALPELDEQHHSVLINGEHLLPFTTDSDFIRCYRCDSWMTSPQYAHPSHRCAVLVTLIDDDDDDIEFDDDDADDLAGLIIDTVVAVVVAVAAVVVLGAFWLALQAAS